MPRIAGTGSGGSTSVAGNDTDVQYNNAGALAGSDNFTFDGTNAFVPNGVVSGMEFLFNREINNNITIPDDYSMISTDMELNAFITLQGDAEIILL